MTIPVFEAAALVLFLVTGAEKAEAAARAFAGAPDRAAAGEPRPLARGRTVVLLDAAAAAGAGIERSIY